MIDNNLDWTIALDPITLRLSFWM